MENGGGGVKESSQISGVVEVWGFRCTALTTLDYMWLVLVVIERGGWFALATECESNTLVLKFCSHVVLAFLNHDQNITSH